MKGLPTPYLREFSKMREEGGEDELGLLVFIDGHGSWKRGKMVRVLSSQNGREEGKQEEGVEKKMIRRRRDGKREENSP